jgi:hypothetical protein
MKALGLYIRKYPHLLIPSGFDEIDLGANLRIRLAATGVWFFYDGLCVKAWRGGGGQVCIDLSTRDPHEPTTLEDAYGWDLSLDELRGFDGHTASIRMGEVLDRCDRSPQFSDQSSIISLPHLWTISNATARAYVASTTRGLIEDLSRNQLTYDQLHWTQLEDIVAELLRSRGMTVHLTPRPADDGRDVIATGTIMGGEPLTIAVEVKHKRTVRIDDVRSRLHANRHFPALLFATSGNFSAGVLREKLTQDVWLRLILKNGGGLRQWIDEYSNQRR